LEGIATVAVGTLAFFVLVDFPATAKFLTPEERAFIVHKKSEYIEPQTISSGLILKCEQNTTIRALEKRKISLLVISGPLLRIGR
jgi:hypothetical protein